MASPKTYDRQTNFLGGMDAYRYAAELERNQSQLLQNVIILDNGRAVTRPGADRLDSNPTTFNNVNPSGPVQGLGFVDNLEHGQQLLLGEGGYLYAWNGSQWSAALSWKLGNQTTPSASVPMATVQGMDQLLISDGVQAMQLWDGSVFSACSTSGEDIDPTNGPTGAACLSFIAGMFVCSGPAMTQGNGTAAQSLPADALVFSNYLSGAAGSWNNANQSIRIGNGDGEAIVAHTPIQSTASTYPIYNLAVLKENSVWILAIQPGAYATYGAMFAALSASAQGDQVGTGIGLVGKNAFCLFQNDVLFMSQDGVQSLQRMQAAAGQYQLTEPLSTPIQPYIDRINWSMAYNIQAVKYRQLAIFFVPLDASTTNNYALVWNGRINKWFIWTGWTPEAAIVTRFGRQIALVMGNYDGSVNQWKDAQNLFGLDSTYLDNDVPIANQNINLRSFTFGNLDLLKKLRATLIRFNQGNAIVNISAFCDLADEDDWSQAVTPAGAVLPVVLPFVLATDQPANCYRSLEGLPYCNEVYLRISTNAGWFDCRNVVMSAFLKPLRDPNA